MKNLYIDQSEWQTYVLASRNEQADWVNQSQLARWECRPITLKNCVLTSHNERAECWPIRIRVLCVDQSQWASRLRQPIILSELGVSSPVTLKICVETSHSKRAACWTVRMWRSVWRLIKMSELLSPNPNIRGVSKFPTVFLVATPPY